MRVGFLSPDLRRHPVGDFTKRLLLHHDHSQIEVTCDHDSVVDDDVSERLAVRMGASILTAAGCADWIATDGAGLVAIAERLAGDLNELQAIRAGLRAKLSTSPLLDGKGFARAFEQAMRAIACRRVPVPRDPPA